MSFRMSANRYLADSSGELLAGERHDSALATAAEAAGLLRGGEVAVPVITKNDGALYGKAVKSVRQVVARFLHETIGEMRAFLGETLPGRHGVAAEKLTVFREKAVDLSGRLPHRIGTHHNERLPGAVRAEKEERLAERRLGHIKQPRIHHRLHHSGCASGSPRGRNEECVEPGRSSVSYLW